MSCRAVFVTGTDTAVGKTRVACALLQAAAASGLRAAGFKPVAAGGIRIADGLCNEDVLALAAAGNVPLTPSQINPYLFHEPIAPHIAAARKVVTIELARIRSAYMQIAERADFVVIEGAGGWQVPLGEQLTTADLVAQMGWPVILVVGMRLGCLNHALLSAESIQPRAKLLGWIANILPPPQPFLEENLQALERRLTSPRVGRLDCGQTQLDLTATGRKLFIPGDA